jgi:hypothetical protein
MRKLSQELRIYFRMKTARCRATLGVPSLDLTVEQRRALQLLAEAPHGMTRRF